MLAAQEMKGVTKTAPKRGMQLGKPKPKSKTLLKELEKQQVIEKPAEEEAKDEEAKPSESYNPLTENVMIDIDERVTC